MKVIAYIKLLKQRGLLKQKISCDNILNKEVNYVSFNSKDIKSDTLFIIKGNDFKAEYLKQAIQKGIFIYVSEKEYDVNLPCLLVNDVRKSLSCISEMYFDYPKNNLNIIGVGGTKGKSTTVCYIKSILDEHAKALGKKDTAILSTIDTYDGVESFKSHITTPELYEVHRHFRNAKNSGIENIVMEVSSQALKLDRVADVRFDIGVFLNISEDHISPVEHTNFADYYDSKMKMFKKTKNAIVGMDADLANKTYEVAKRDSENVFTFSIQRRDTDFYAYDIKKDGLKTVFMVHTPSYDSSFTLNTIGKFNIENAIAAIASSYLMNVQVEVIKQGLENAKTNGRMEIYHTRDMKIVVIVDYAHNKLSFEKVFSLAKEEYPNRQIISLFGCPGDKAQVRRGQLGIIAGQNSDFIYITADDPGFERVEDISNEIAKYVDKYTKNYSLIENRGDAIEMAISLASSMIKPTIVLLLGKGRDCSQKYGQKYVSCPSDVDYALKYLKKYDNKK